MRYYNYYGAAQTEEAKTINDKIYETIKFIFKEFEPTSAEELIELKCLIESSVGAELSFQTCLFSRNKQIRVK